MSNILNIEDPLETLIIFTLLLFTPYFWNGYKLFKCDFESSYKCEIIHGVGLIIPPAALITVWADVDH